MTCGCQGSRLPAALERKANKDEDSHSVKYRNRHAWGLGRMGGGFAKRRTTSSTLGRKENEKMNHRDLAWDDYGTDGPRTDRSDIA